MAGRCFAAPALIDLLIVSPENGGSGNPSVSLAKGVKVLVAIGLGVTPMGPRPSGAASMVGGMGILFADASVPNDQQSCLAVNCDDCFDALGWTESVLIVPWWHIPVLHWMGGLVP